MKLRKPDGRSNVEKKIDVLLEQELEKVHNLKDLSTVISLAKRRKDLGKKNRVSPDTIAIVAGNLLGIGIILTYERTQVIATKAFGLILRGRV